MLRVRSGAACVLLAAACTGSGTAGISTGTGPDPFADDALATLAGIEDRLTSASSVELEIRARAMGVVVADLRGVQVIERELRASMRVAGSFAGTEVELTWSSVAPLDPDLRDVQSPTWADALLIGDVRMGAMHNFALVIGGQDPETAHGDVRTWIEADQVEWKDGDPETRTLRFRLLVEGQPTAECELALDERGLPRRRDQTVSFPEGKMRVVEDYLRIELAP